MDDLKTKHSNTWDKKGNMDVMRTSLNPNYPALVVVEHTSYCGIRGEEPKFLLLLYLPL